MLKLVILDAGDVIYDSKYIMKKFYEEHEKFFKKFGIDPKEDEKLWMKYYKKVQKGKVSLKKARELIFEKLGVPKSKLKEWLRIDREIKMKYIRPFKNAKGVMRKIKKIGLRIAILSDTAVPSSWRIQMSRKIGIVEGREYDKGFYSNVIGYVKPEKKAYLTVLKYFNVKPSEAIFVGHDKEEIEGAKRVGIKTIAFREKVRAADFYAKDWNEIYQIVKILKKI